MSSSQYKRRRAINFDLNGDALKKHYSESNPNGAYKDIARFMKKHGFIHRQWSGYCSEKTLTNFELLQVFDEMYNKMPWLNVCAERMDATTIGSIYDIKKMESKGIREGVDKENIVQNQQQKGKPSVLKRLQENKEKISKGEAGSPRHMEKHIGEAERSDR